MQQKEKVITMNDLNHITFKSEKPRMTGREIVNELIREDGRLSLTVHKQFDDGSQYISINLKVNPDWFEGKKNEILLANSPKIS